MAMKKDFVVEEEGEDAVNEEEEVCMCQSVCCGVCMV